MKTESDIRKRIRSLLSQELDRRVREAGTRLPRRCVYNHRQPLDVRKEVTGERNDSYNRVTTGHRLPVAQTIGLCMFGAENPEEWPGTICEDPIDAQRCSVFTQKITKQQIWDEFSKEVADLEWLRSNMGEVYALLWVLEAQAASQLPWWKRLWFRLARIEQEPRSVAYDPALLLPENSVDESVRAREAAGN